MSSSRATVGAGKLPLHLSSSQNRIHIKNGTVVNDDRMYQADIYIENGIIKQVGTQLTVPGGLKVIDATGLYVLPGGLDTHTHMQFPFMGTHSSDDFYTGTRAALAGGTTCIIDFVCAHRGQSLLDQYDTYRDWADNKVCCDYALHVIVPEYNAKVASEMEVLVKERGINSFKCFLAYPGVFMIEDDHFYEVLKKCRQLGALVQVHAENGKLIDIKQKEMVDRGVLGPEGHLYSRPEESEVEATNRAIMLADAAECPLYVVHVMSSKAAEMIAKARQNGVLVWGEAIAAALSTNGDNYTHSCWKHAAGHVMSPPLRPGTDTGRQLLKYLANGDLECTGTDHCVFKVSQKALGKDDFRKIPNGVNGVEDRMSVIWEKGVRSGILDPCKFVAITSTNAAKVFNLYPRKGRIDVGSDADLVVWDPNAVRTISATTHHQNVDFNIFEGMVCHGVPKTVICGGRIVLDSENGLRVIQGAGRFLPTDAFPPHLYAKVRRREEIKGEECKPVKRQPYEGPIIDLVSEMKSHALIEEEKHKEEGPKLSAAALNARTMQGSSFSLGGGDTAQAERSSIRTNQAPGGKSTALW